MIVFLFSAVANNDNIFYKAYTSYPGYVYDKNHNYWKDYYPPKLFNATYDSPGITSIEENMRPTRGFMPTRTHGWGEPTNATDSCWMDYEANFNNYNKNFELFEQLLQTCLENDIVVIGVITPQNPRYKETGTFGYRGLRRSEAAVSIKNIKQLRDTYPNFILMDENNMGNHDYSDDMAWGKVSWDAFKNVDGSHNVDIICSDRISVAFPHNWLRC